MNVDARRRSCFFDNKAKRIALLRDKQLLISRMLAYNIRPTVAVYCETKNIHRLVFFAITLPNVSIIVHTQIGYSKNEEQYKSYM